MRCFNHYQCVTSLLGGKFFIIFDLILSSTNITFNRWQFRVEIPYRIFVLFALYQKWFISTSINFGVEICSNQRVEIEHQLNLHLPVQKVNYSQLIYSFSLCLWNCFDSFASRAIINPKLSIRGWLHVNWWC